MPTPTRAASDKRCRIESIWANPFRLDRGEARSVVLDRYRSYISRRLDNEPGLRSQLADLQGQRLGCWCAPKLCHGDVLVELIEATHPADQIDDQRGGRP